MQRDVRELNDAAARGDRAAVDALIERYLPDLRAFVRLRAGPLVRARESSSDLVQSVCREVLEHQERFRYSNDSAFKHWLFTTALRKIQHRRDYWLAQKRDALREVPVEVAGGSASSHDDRALLARYQSFSSPSRQAMVREELEQLESAFDQLPEEYREVITLAHVVGLSRAQIGERLGRSELAVRSLLHRALARLSKLLGQAPG